ncbi:centrosomal protein of 57 kDa-like isoform X2 [Limulus polyphemus]|uniref:Centrosomal protein of 57 kDa-like isoform X2 n=1 Tax=Limulus polyphemus TaxID=6850 RepID=A0ABM1SC71_LIMPO|nr:centrosomal protein of 57 kDa-like isoform X2 [Limulus polyphemus]
MYNLVPGLQKTMGGGVVAAVLKVHKKMKELENKYLETKKQLENLCDQTEATEDDEYELKNLLLLSEAQCNLLEEQLLYARDVLSKKLDMRTVPPSDLGSSSSKVSTVENIRTDHSHNILWRSSYAEDGHVERTDSTRIGDNWSLITPQKAFDYPNKRETKKKSEKQQIPVDQINPELLQDSGRTWNSEMHVTTITESKLKTFPADEEQKFLNNKYHQDKKLLIKTATSPPRKELETLTTENERQFQTSFANKMQKQSQNKSKEPIVKHLQNQTVEPKEIQFQNLTSEHTVKAFQNQPTEPVEKYFQTSTPNLRENQFQDQISQTTRKQFQNETMESVEKLFQTSTPDLKEMQLQTQTMEKQFKNQTSEPIEKEFQNQSTESIKEYFQTLTPNLGEKQFQNQTTQTTRKQFQNKTIEPVETNFQTSTPDLNKKQFQTQTTQTVNKQFLNLTSEPTGKQFQSQAMEFAPEHFEIPASDLKEKQVPNSSAELLKNQLLTPVTPTTKEKQLKSFTTEPQKNQLQTPSSVKKQGRSRKVRTSLSDLKNEQNFVKNNRNVKTDYLLPQQRTRQRRQRTASCSDISQARASKGRTGITRHFQLRFQDIPFVAGKSTSASHSVTVNMQNLIAMLKKHNPKLCSRSAHRRSCSVPRNESRFPVEEYVQSSESLRSARSLDNLDVYRDFSELLTGLQDEFELLALFNKIIENTGLS